MQYVNYLQIGSDETVLHTAPVAQDDAAYLQRIIAELRPLSEEDYMNGPAVLMHTLAKYSYVLNGHELFWCVEWKPGLIVVRFSPNEGMACAAIRSPVPNFGGRNADDVECDTFDEDANNPQYNLIFDPWDAQCDAQNREWKSFMRADSDVQIRFKYALARINELDDIMEQRFSDDRDAWLNRCKQNLEAWCGDGVHLA